MLGVSQPKPLTVYPSPPRTRLLFTRKADRRGGGEAERRRGGEAERRRGGYNKNIYSLAQIHASAMARQ